MHPDLRVLAAAGRQHGCVSVAQPPRGDPARAHGGARRRAGQTRGLTTHDQLTGSLTRRRSSRGAGAFQAILRPAQFTRSEAERRFLALIRDARLPEPAVNTRVGGYEVDFLWPSKRLIVEIDGYAFHSSRAALERDRRRDAELRTIGAAVAAG